MGKVPALHCAPARQNADLKIGHYMDKGKSAASLFAEELAGVGGGFAFVFVLAVDEDADALF